MEKIRDKSGRYAAKAALAAAVCILSIGFQSDAVASGFNPGERVVRCDLGQQVQDVLDRQAFWRRPQTLTLVGTCDGFTIDRDDVTIRGVDDASCRGAIILGTVINNGARRTRFSCLALDGVGTGMVVKDGDVELQGILVDGMPVGIEITQGGHAELIGGAIRVSDAGVLVEQGTVEIEGTDFRLFSGPPSNTPYGLRLQSNSHATIRGGFFEYLDSVRGPTVEVKGSSSLEIEDTVMQGNGVSGAGLLVRDGSNATLTNVSIFNYRFNGIRVQRNSSLQLEGGEISGNDFRGIRLDDHSSATISDASIVGHGRVSILLTGDSGLRVGGEFLQVESFDCEDDESSVEFDDGSTPFGCTGF